MSPERKKMVTIALVVIVTIILLLLMRRKPSAETGTVTLPDYGFTPGNYTYYNTTIPDILIPDYHYPEIPPIDLNKTSIVYPPAGTCGCDAGGLLPDFQSLLNVYTQRLGGLLDSYYSGIEANLPGYVAQFVHNATDTGNPHDA